MEVVENIIVGKQTYIGVEHKCNHGISNDQIQTIANFSNLQNTT